MNSLYYTMKIQKKYKILINDINMRFFYEKKIIVDPILVINRINSFWNANIGVITNELQMLHNPERLIILQGATHLDFNSKEKYILSLLGDIHAVPDPFIQLEDVFRYSQDSSFLEKLTEIMNEAFLDIYTLVNEYNDSFIVLPVLLFGMEIDKRKAELFTMSKNCIAGLFDYPINDFDEKINALKTFEDIEEAIPQHLLNNIIFNSLEDRNLPLRDRINIYKNNNEFAKCLFNVSNEITEFKIIMSQFFSQAIEIYCNSNTYGYVSYIRYDIAFSYYQLIASINKTDAINNKIKIEHLLFLISNYADTEILCNLKWEEFKKKQLSGEFEKILFLNLQNDNLEIGRSNLLSFISCINKSIAQFVKISS